MKYIVYCMLVCFVIACHNTPHTPPASPDTTEAPGPLPNLGDYNFVLAKRGDSLTIETTVDTPLVNKTIEIDIRTAGTLAGSLYTGEQPANLRFNQVIEPSGKADGPFGKEISYLVTKTGIYKLVIGSSRMAEDPYSGKVKVKLALK